MKMKVGVFSLSLLLLIMYLVKHSGAESATRRKKGAISQPPNPVQIDDFCKFRLSGLPLVDKSLFIVDAVFERYYATVITRPPKFGKSLNIDMLYRFMDVHNAKQNRILFEGGEYSIEKRSGDEIIKVLTPLKIANYSDVMKLQGTIPVIRVSFADVDGRSLREFIGSMKRVVVDMFKNIDELDNLRSLTDGDPYYEKVLDRFLGNNISRIDLIRSFDYLSYFLHKKYNSNVTILIDEYDRPMSAGLLRFGKYPTRFELIRGIYQGMLIYALKVNKYLRHAIMIGVLMTPRENANRFVYHTVLHMGKFINHFGFTRSETENLFNNEMYRIGEVDMEMVQSHYGGYDFANEKMFNPWSVMNFIEMKGEFQNYWKETRLLAMVQSDLKSDMEVFFEGPGSLVNILRKDLVDHFGLVCFLDILVFTGHLSATLRDEPRPLSMLYNITIPNDEVKSLLEEYIKKLPKKSARRKSASSAVFDRDFGHP